MSIPPVRRRRNRRVCAPSPLARGFVTYGTDSGHESRPGEPPQLFALNDEAFENFAHRAYKKVRDVAVVLMQRAYGKKPDKMYFMGSSEGGREGLAMAQRYPDDFDGIFARVPVINWVGLQHAGTRSGLITMGEGWINPAQVKLVGEAVRAACDKADGSDDALVQDPVACKAAKLSWETTAAVLACRYSTGSPGAAELARTRHHFLGMTTDNARRMLSFWQVRASTSPAQTH